MDFEKHFQKTMDDEGRTETNDPDDPGKQTFWGISRVAWPNWPGWQVLDSHSDDPINSVLPGMVKDFYLTVFWNPEGCNDLIDENLAGKIFNISVLAGKGTGIKLAQKSANVLNKNGSLWPDIAVDGQSGPMTINALNDSSRYNPDVLLKLIESLFVAHCVDNAEKNPTLEKYIKGWVYRAFETN